MPTTRRLVTTILILLAGLVTSSAAIAYTVVLKDGTHLQAREEFTVENGIARIELTNGNVISVREEQIDVDATRDFNARNLGTAVTVDGRRTVPHEQGQAPVQTLDEMLRQRRAQGQNARGEQQETTPRTVDGHPDLVQLRRAPYSGETAESLRRSLTKAGVNQVRMFEGTRPGRVLLEIQTTDEAEVFEALRASARTYEEVAYPSSIAAFELLMMTPGRTRAGQFLMGIDEARLLNQGKISTTDFFMRFVQF